MRAGVHAHRIATWLLLAAALAGALAYSILRATPAVRRRPGRVLRDAWSADGHPDRADRRAGGRARRPATWWSRSPVCPMEAWLRDVATAARSPTPTPRGRSTTSLERDGADARDGRSRWAPPAIGATLLAGWSVLLFSVATAGVAAYVFARRPEVPAATALMVCACGAAGSSLPWFLGTTVSDVVQGAAVPAPCAAHRTAVHAPVAGRPPPRARVPEPVTAVQRHRMARPRRLRRRARGLRGRHGARGAPRARPRSTGSVDGRRSSWRSSRRSCCSPSSVFAVRYLRTTEPAARARVRLVTLSLARERRRSASCCSRVAELVLGRSVLPAGGGRPRRAPAAPRVRRGDPPRPPVRPRRRDQPQPRLRRHDAWACSRRTSRPCRRSTVLAGQEPGFAGSLLATGLAALVALPLRDVLQRAVNRAMYGSRDEPWRAMRGLGARLEWAVDPERAFPAIAESVAEALRLPYVGRRGRRRGGPRRRWSPSTARRPPTVEAMPLVHGGGAGRAPAPRRAGGRARVPTRRARAAPRPRAPGGRRDPRPAAARRPRPVAGAPGASTREEERRRLRRDLHDGLGPTLAAVGMRAEAAAAVLDDGPGGGPPPARGAGR